jgi:hypothetical protein
MVDGRVHGAEAFQNEHHTFGEEKSTVTFFGVIEPGETPLSSTFEISAETKDFERKMLMKPGPLASHLQCYVTSSVQ